MPRKPQKGAQILTVRDAKLVEDIDAHIEKLNAENPDDPYDRGRWVRVTLRKAMRERVGHRIEKRSLTPT